MFAVHIYLIILKKKLHITSNILFIMQNQVLYSLTEHPYQPMKVNQLWLHLFVWVVILAVQPYIFKPKQRLLLLLTSMSYQMEQQPLITLGQIRHTQLIQVQIWYVIFCIAWCRSILYNLLSLIFIGFFIYFHFDQYVYHLSTKIILMTRLFF